MKLHELGGARCTFCQGTMALAEDVADGCPVLMHSDPPCEEFTTLDGPKYLAENVARLGRQRLN